VKRFIIIIIFTSLWSLFVNAQISGTIVDGDGYAIPYASAMYKGNHKAAISDIDGKFRIERHNGWVLTFSCVGFRSQQIKIDANTPSNLKIVLKNEESSLSEVVIKSKRAKYSRKNNPAVELMRRVIEAKKKNDLDNHEYYHYNKYQKITLAINDITKADMDSGFFKKKWLVDQIETSPYNNKLILPILVNETVTQRIYRKQPKSEKDIIKGQRSDGINNILQTGEILNTTLKDVFTDVDIYDDHIRLLQYQFTSPIGSTAISFYRYYIEDTVYVDHDLCYHLQFIPNNQQDFGFRGDLYVLADSSLHVKKCSMTIPKRSDVNFVNDMKITQEYTRLSDGEWVLTTDDMMAELSITNVLRNALVVRTTRLSDYAFDNLPDKLFKGKAKVKHESLAMNRGEDFWNQYRTVDLTKSESSMDAFLHRMEQSKNYKWVVFGVKALLENYVETGSQRTSNKFDFGPVNTLVSSNFVDDLRFRVSGRTTANVSNHFFWDGYYAYGTKSNKNYYSSEFTYSLNKKQNVPFEFPQRNIIFESSYDVMSPSDKFLFHNKDNAFMAFRWQKVEQMYFYNRQKLSFIYETDWGLSFNSFIKAESNEPTGDLAFKRMSESPLATNEPLVNKIRTTEFSLGVRYYPGQTFINTKQRRLPLNLDSPDFSLTHTMAVKGFLGGQYRYNYTEMNFYKRFWLGSWGYLDSHIDAGAQWNKVPFPLLIMPPSNMTYFVDQENTFQLMRNMEFLNDRYALWSVSWDLNGKLLNRIPLIRHLKWREYISFRGMFGRLTDKNNPFLASNAADNKLFQFPEGSYVMDRNKPYMELMVGAHNIFKFFAVYYVRRFSYLDNPQIKKNGIRFAFMVSF
jgi:hypothetical protein